MRKILLVQGANLSYLGKREPEIYGKTTSADLDKMLLNFSEKHNLALEIFYSNIEGEAINKIYESNDKGIDGIIMNPAGFTYILMCENLDELFPTYLTWPLILPNLHRLWQLKQFE